MFSNTRQFGKNVSSCDSECHERGPNTCLTILNNHEWFILIVLWHITLEEFLYLWLLLLACGFSCENVMHFWTSRGGSDLGVSSLIVINKQCNSRSGHCYAVKFPWLNIPGMDMEPRHSKEPSHIFLCNKTPNQGVNFLINLLSGTR